MDKLTQDQKDILKDLIFNIYVLLPIILGLITYTKIIVLEITEYERYIALLLLLIIIVARAPRRYLRKTITITQEK